MASIMAAGGGFRRRDRWSQRFFPPLVRYAGRFPLGKRVDAVDRARGQALVASTAQFGDDDDIGTVVEDRTELRRAGAQAGIAVDALEHLDAQRIVLPLRASRACCDAFRAGRRHPRECRSTRRSRDCRSPGGGRRGTGQFATSDDSDERVDDASLELGAAARHDVRDCFCPRSTRACSDAR